MNDDVVRLAHGRHLGEKLMDALGLTGQQITRIVLTADVNDAAKVTVERLLTRAEVDSIERVVSEYELIQDTTTIGSDHKTARRAG